MRRDANLPPLQDKLDRPIRGRAGLTFIYPSKSSNLYTRCRLAFPCHEKRVDHLIGDIIVAVRRCRAHD